MRLQRIRHDLASEQQWWTPASKSGTVAITQVTGIWGIVMEVKEMVKFWIHFEGRTNRIW